MSKTDDEEAVGRWVLDTCLLFGTTFETAALVAAHFVRGVFGDQRGGDLCEERGERLPAR